MTMDPDMPIPDRPGDPTPTPPPPAPGDLPPTEVRPIDPVIPEDEAAKLNAAIASTMQGMGIPGQSSGGAMLSSEFRPTQGRNVEDVFPQLAGQQEVHIAGWLEFMIEFRKMAQDVETMKTALTTWLARQ